MVLIPKMLVLFSSCTCCLILGGMAVQLLPSKLGTRSWAVYLHHVMWIVAVGGDDHIRTVQRALNEGVIWHRHYITVAILQHNIRHNINQQYLYQTHQSAVLISDTTSISSTYIRHNISYIYYYRSTTNGIIDIYIGMPQVYEVFLQSFCTLIYIYSTHQKQKYMSCVVIS